MSMWVTARTCLSHPVLLVHGGRVCDIVHTIVSTSSPGLVIVTTVGKTEWISTCLSVWNLCACV